MCSNNNNINNSVIKPDLFSITQQCGGFLSPVWPNSSNFYLAVVCFWYYGKSRADFVRLNIFGRQSILLLNITGKPKAIVGVVQESGQW